MDINGTPLTTARAIQMTVGGGIAITIFVLSGGWPEGWMDVFAFGCGFSIFFYGWNDGWQK